MSLFNTCLIRDDMTILTVVITVVINDWILLPCYVFVMFITEMLSMTFGGDCNK